jgi:hypothetical protein
VAAIAIVVPCPHEARVTSFTRDGQAESAIRSADDLGSVVKGIAGAWCVVIRGIARILVPRRGIAGQSDGWSSDAEVRRLFGVVPAVGRWRRTDGDGRKRRPRRIAETDERPRKLQQVGSAPAGGPIPAGRCAVALVVAGVIATVATGDDVVVRVVGGSAQAGLIAQRVDRPAARKPGCALAHTRCRLCQSPADTS